MIYYPVYGLLNIFHIFFRPNPCQSVLAGKTSWIRWICRQFSGKLQFCWTGTAEELLLGLAGAYPMIVVSHSPGQAERLAHAVAVFSQGRVVQQLKKSAITWAELEKCIDCS